LRRVWNSWKLLDSEAGWDIDSEAGWAMKCEAGPPSCSQDQPRRPDAPLRRGLTVGRTSTRPEVLLHSTTTGPCALSQDPSPARRDRVERIRLAIANGSYHVSAADLAQKLIDRMIRHHR
jgi:hypothetical protein